MKAYNTDSELDKLVDSDDFEDRIRVAEQSYGLDKLVNDEDLDVRKAVAEQGYGLNKLIYDKEWFVRREVARQGYGLDRLIDDNDWHVRKATCDYLYSNHYKSVFEWAKENNVDLDIDKWLISDSWCKRREVSKQGYGLDKLINDDNSDVHCAVYDYLNEYNYKSVFDWAKDNGVDIDLDEWVHSDDWIKRYEVARQGYRLDIFVYDENKEVRTAVYDYLKEHSYKSIFDWAKDNNISIDIDKWLNSDDWTKRYAVAKQGYGLDKLVNDENWEIREVVAIKGYGLDKLVNDEYCSIRIIVAKQGYGLEKLVYDDNWQVRDAVTDYLNEHNYKSVFEWAKDNNIDIDLDEWLNSNDFYKRCEVAKQGYRLDILINDEDLLVCDAVHKYLAENNLTIDEWCIQNNKSPVIIQNLKNFIYKIEGSSKIKVETSYDFVDNFFDDTSDKSYEDKESITLVTVDTKIPLIKLEKTRVENNNCFKFIVDISNDKDTFSVKSIFDTKVKFDQLLQSTINTLHEYSQFTKYADELENCL